MRDGNGRKEGRKQELKGITIHIMKANRGSRGAAALFVNLDTR